MLFTTIDIETTGLDKYNSDIIQFAYSVTNETGKLVKAECLFFYYPGVERSWSEEAFKIHQIPLQELRTHAEEFETNCKKMWIAVSKSNCVSYNGDRFDIPFIQKWLRKIGFPEPEVYTSFDVFKIFSSHGLKGKLINAPEKIGLKEEIIQAITAKTFGESGRAHLAYYDIVATNLCFNYAINKKWVNLNPVTNEQADDDRTQRLLNEAEGRRLYNNIKYIIQDTNGNMFEVALCPDPDRFIYYKQEVFEKTPIFIEDQSNPGYFNQGMICLHVTPDKITLEPRKDVN